MHVTRTAPRRATPLGLLGASALLVATAGCQADSPSAAVDYYRDVEPILRQNCVRCHRPGGSGPTDLSTYEAARVQSRAIVAAVKSRAMPPIPAVADGSCQTFSDATWLTDQQIDLVDAWVSADTPAGPARTLAPLPPPDTLSDAASFPMPAAYTPATGADNPDVYRCFVLGQPIEKDGYVTAAEFLPSTDQVHHILTYTVDPARDLGGFTNAEGIASMEAGDPEPGWDCYFGVGPGAAPRNQLPGWAHGEAVARLPDGVGLRVHAGDLVVVQMHYRATDPVPDRTELRLAMTDKVTTPAIAVFRDPATFAEPPWDPLPPAAQDAKLHWSLPASDVAGELVAQGLGDGSGFQVLGVAGHMHELGTRFDFQLIDGASSTCGLRIEPWDFSWQRSYLYQSPIVVSSPDASLDVTCTYDTRGVSAPTYFGHDKGKEMCSLIAYVAPL